MANRKRHPAWNKGLPKNKQPMFGKKHSKKTKFKISQSEKGKKVSEETKKKIGLSYVKTEKRLKQITELGRAGKGDNSPNWKGGKSRAYKNGYYSIEYRKWRKQIFERDNYICQKCFKNKGQRKYLTAHHINSFAKYPELRYDLNNGITLCEVCHSLTDNYKGRAKSKNVSQIEECSA